MDTPEITEVDRAHLFLALGVAAMLRLWNLGWYELWAEEIHTQLLSECHASDLLSPGFMAPYTPLYFLITHFISRVLHPTEFGLRLLSAMAGLALLPVLFRLCRELLGSVEARAALWLAAVNPVLVYFSREHRMYSLYITAVAAALLAAVRLMQGDRTRDRARLFLWTSLAFLIFPFAALYLAALPILLVRNKATLKRLVPLALAAVIAGVWGLAMILTASSGEALKYRNLDFAQIANAMKTFSIGNFSMQHADLRWIGYIGTFLMSALCLAGIVKKSGDRRTLLFWAAFLTIPYAVTLVLQIRSGPVYNYKSYLPGVLVVLFFAVAGVAALPKFAGRLALGLLLALSLRVDAALLDRAHFFNWQTPRDLSHIALGRALAESRLPIEAGYAYHPAAMFQSMYYGLVPGRPLYGRREQFLKAHPSHNWRSLEVIWRDRGVRDWSETGDSPPAMIAVAGWDPTFAPLLPDYTEDTRARIAGAALLRRK